MRIRRGDSVVVITGDDSGDTPRKVIQVIGGGKKLVIEGVNRVHKHVRRGHPKNPQGGRLQFEMPVDASNVLYHCATCNKGVRLGSRYTDDGTKERFCKSCRTGVGVISPARARYAKS